MLGAATGDRKHRSNDKGFRGDPARKQPSALGAGRGRRRRVHRRRLRALPREQGNLAQGPGAWPRECTGGDQRAGQELEGEAFEVGQGSGRGRLAEAGPHAALLARSRGASSPGWFTGLLAHSFAGALSCWFTAPLAQARAGSPAAFHRLSGSPLLARSPDGSNPCWFAAAVAQTLTVQMPSGSQPRCFKAVLAQGPLGSQPCWFKSPLVYSSILCWFVVGWFVLCSSFAFGFLIFWFAVLLAHSFPDSTVGSQPCWFTGPG